MLAESDENSSIRDLKTVSQPNFCIKKLTHANRVPVKTGDLCCDLGTFA